MNVLKTFEIVRAVVLLLVNKQYEEIYDTTDESRKEFKKGASTEFIKNVINDYPGDLTEPPTLESYLDFYLSTLEDPDEFMVDFFLWVNNEKSDLAMRLIIRTDTDEYKYCLYGILIP